MHRKLDFEQIEVGDIIRANHPDGTVFHLKVENVHSDFIVGEYKAKGKSTNGKFMYFGVGLFGKTQYNYVQLNKSYL